MWAIFFEEMKYIIEIKLKWTLLRKKNSVIDF